MKILVISAHPDDMEINCAGTLAKCVARGDEVTICNLCDGDMGHVVIEPDELRVMRNKEADRAAAVIGAKHRTMNVHDLTLYHQKKEMRDCVVDIMREEMPDFMITHAPNDYMPDHIAASELTFGASFCASLPHYGTQRTEVVPICPIYYMDNLGCFQFEPTEYVDISDVVNTKLKMLQCHESQLKWMKDHDGIDFCDTVKTFSKMRGAQCGVLYAEGFRQLAGWGRMTTKRLLP